MSGKGFFSGIDLTPRDKIGKSARFARLSHVMMKGSFLGGSKSAKIEWLNHWQAYEAKITQELFLMLRWSPLANLLITFVLRCCKCRGLEWKLELTFNRKGGEVKALTAFCFWAFKGTKHWCLHRLSPFQSSLSWRSLHIEQKSFPILIVEALRC